MPTDLTFPHLLGLVQERSLAFRAAVASSPDLGAVVPTCPEWTLRDLVQHLGQVHRRWAANVTAGPADGPAPRAAEDAPEEREALLEWSAASTELLLSALRGAGADRPCWTWWGGSQSPQTSGAVARHQVQEAAVHAYDAQGVGGAVEALPEDVALDGVEEFLLTSCTGTDPWPHDPAAVDYSVTAGPSWRLRLSADGSQVVRLRAVEPSSSGQPDACLRGSASDLVLELDGRVPVRSLEVTGDPGVFDRLLAWDPGA